MLNDSFIGMLEGMFAFAIYDSKEHSLMLGRDRSGIKPLYYQVFKDGLCFASSLSSLRYLLPNEPQINNDAIRRYLFFEYIPAPDTIFDNVRKLEPAFWLKVKADIVTSKKYWELQPISLENRSTAELSESFLQRFRAS